MNVLLGASLVAQTVKNPPAMQETQVLYWNLEWARGSPGAPGEGGQRCSRLAFWFVLFLNVRSLIRHSHVVQC